MRYCLWLALMHKDIQTGAPLLLSTAACSPFCTSHPLAAVAASVIEHTWPVADASARGAIASTSLSCKYLLALGERGNRGTEARGRMRVRLVCFPEANNGEPPHLQGHLHA